MNTPSPLIPQGTFPDNRGRSHIRIAVFTILAVHIVLLGALLMAGCKKTTDTTGEGTTSYTNTAFQPPTNATLPPETSVAPPLSNVAPINNIPPPPTNTTLVNPPVPPEGEKEHVVVKGDSFYTLGKKYGVTTKAIENANPGVDSTKLKIGQKLKIPPGSPTLSAGTPHTASNGTGTSNGGQKIYTVKSGDNLMKIAKDNGTSVKALRSANSLKTDRITVGQKLKIPAKASAPPAEAVSTGAVPVSPP